MIIIAWSNRRDRLAVQAWGKPIVLAPAILLGDPTQIHVLRGRAHAHVVPARAHEHAVPARVHEVTSDGL